jgi:hypothetical protein
LPIIASTKRITPVYREAIMAAQAMQMGTIDAPISMDKKTYAVSFKGLIAHLLDILFTDNSEPRAYYANDLSGHMQKDIGLYR